MSKISTYPSAETPLLLSDRLIGTEAIRPVPSPTPLATKNFSLGELLQLFSANFPAASLQAVLDTGNTATQNITLTGTISATLMKPVNIEDTSGSQGTTFQFLSKGTSSINWVNLPVDNLQAVLNAGNTATQNINLVGNITLTKIIPENIQDDTASIGTTGQVLSKTASGIRWINNPTVTTPGLADVLSVGNSANNDIYVNSFYTNTGYALMDDGTVIGQSFQFPGNLSYLTYYGSTFNLWELPNASGVIALTSDIPDALTLTTTGTSGPATLVGSVLNVPNYATSGAQDLNDVLTIGNTSILSANMGTIGIWDPTNSDYLYLDSDGAKLAATFSGALLFQVQIGSLGFTNNSSAFAEFQSNLLTLNRVYTLPDQSGTVALLSDIPTGGGIPHATASGTDTYSATITGITTYSDGDAYLVRFTNGNTTGCTLNINLLGAIPLYRNNDGALIGGDIWDGAEMLCVYNSTLNIFQCIGTSSNSLFAYVTNADSVAITKGQPVYAFGGTGDRLTVKRALNTSDATSAQTVGVVLTSSIAVNQKGIIIIQGLLDGLSILPTSTWADGDPVYLGTTAGSITKVKQYAPNHLVYLGTVTTASNGSAGRWYVRVQNGYELDELHNVQAQTPSLKDTLWYDSGVTPGQWKTASISTILGYTPFNLPSLTSGSVLFSNGTTIAQDNSNFFWDDANNRLGIGTNFPSNSLTINDSSSVQIFLKSTTGVEGISSFGGGNLASFDITTGGTYRYGPLTMFPPAMDITFGGQDIFYGNITSDFIPKKATIGFSNSLIYDDGTNVGIGTIIPATKLDVNGVITATGGNSTSWNAKQDAITLTTTGTSGPATLVGATLNIPQYSGGGGGSTPVKLTSQTLAVGSWTLVSGYYTYAFSNVNVTTTCDVSVTPQNASYLTAYNAQVLPFVGVAAGVATFYSQFPPQADIVVDIVITQTT